MLDRSWYGRVLVERVEGFASAAPWERAYDEIVALGQGLCVERNSSGVGFTSPTRSSCRFHRRERLPLKSWKLTEEDWRNRERRAEYETAVTAMLERTDHDCARWTVIPGDSKRYARVTVVEAEKSAPCGETAWWSIQAPAFTSLRRG